MSYNHHFARVNIAFIHILLKLFPFPILTLNDLEYLVIRHKNSISVQIYI